MSRILDKLKGIKPEKVNKRLNLLRKWTPSTEIDHRTSEVFIRKHQRLIISTLSASVMLSILIFIGFTAIKTMDSNIEVAEQKAPSSRSLQIENNKMALRLYRSSNYVEAISIWRNLSKLFPENIEIYVNLALAYKKSNELDLSLQALNRAIELDPTDGIAQNNLGLLAIRLGDNDLAKKSLELAVVHEPNLIEPLFNLASFYEKMAIYDLAMKYYKKIITHPKAEKKMISIIRKRLPRLHSVHVFSMEKKRGRI